VDTRAVLDDVEKMKILDPTEKRSRVKTIDRIGLV
jgi:hypothetical protein